MNQEIVIAFNIKNKIRSLSKDGLNAKNLDGFTSNRGDAHIDIYPIVTAKNGYQFLLNSKNYKVEIKDGYAYIHLDTKKILSNREFEPTKYFKLMSLIDGVYEHQNAYFDLNSSPISKNCNVWVDKSIYAGYIFLPMKAEEFLNVLSKIKDVENLNGRLLYKSDVHEDLTVYVEDYTDKIERVRNCPSYQSILKISVENKSDLIEMADFFKEEEFENRSNLCRDWFRVLINEGKKIESGHASYLFSILDEKLGKL